MKEPFEVYKEFLAIRSHFTSSYDYFKYRGKIKATYDAYMRAKGKFFYGKIAKKYKEDSVNYISRIFASDIKPGWIGDLDSEDADKIWLEHRKYIESSKYSFKSDLRTIKDSMQVNGITDLRSLLISTENELPAIQKMLKKGLTRFETCVILHKLTLYGHKVKSENPLWESDSLLLRKYAPFFKVNLSDYAEILRDYI